MAHPTGAPTQPVHSAMDASFAPYERRRHILATQITPWFATHPT